MFLAGFQRPPYDIYKGWGDVDLWIQIAEKSHVHLDTLVSRAKYYQDTYNITLIPSKNQKEI
jgi:hypothetical protein